MNMLLLLPFLFLVLEGTTVIIGMGLLNTPVTPMNAYNLEEKEDLNFWSKGVTGQYIQQSKNNLDCISFLSDSEEEQGQEGGSYCSWFPRPSLPTWAQGYLYSRASMKEPFPIHKYRPSSRSAPLETWLIESEDGGVSQMYYFPVSTDGSGASSSSTTPLVLFLPGNGEIHWRLASVSGLNEKFGYDVALLDYRGHNPNLPSAEITEEGLTLDAVNSVRSLLIRNKISSSDRPVFILGVSLGTAVTLGLLDRLTTLSTENEAIRRFLKGNFRGVVLDAPFSKISRAASHLAHQYVPRTRLIPQTLLRPAIDLALRVTGHHFDSQAKLHRLLKIHDPALWNNKFPILIMGNEQDDVTTVDQAEHLHAMCRMDPKKENKMYKSFDCRHGCSCDFEEEFYSTLEEFFRTSLQ